MPKEAEFWTVGDCARHLDMSGEGVRVAANEGRLPVALRLPSGLRLFLPGAVRRFGELRDKSRGRRTREEA